MSSDIKPLLRWKRYTPPLAKKWNGWCRHVSLPMQRRFFVRGNRLICREVTYSTDHYAPLRIVKEEDQDWGAIDVTGPVTRALKPFGLVLPGVLYEAARFAVKEARCPQEKSYEQFLSKDIARWAERRIQEEVEELEATCVDNWRVARLGNSPQMRRYRRQQKRGCCGSHDIIRKGPDGNKYMLGFNYGH